MSPTSPRLTDARHQATAPPFKVHRGSHLIHKQPPLAAGSSSSSSNSSVNSSSSSGSGLTTTNNGAAHRPPPRQHKQPQQQQQPVIIYTHSPKVIRTNPRDFMSIVQKLTGLESSVAARAGVCLPGANKEAGSTATSQEESSSSTDSCANQAHIAAPPSYVDPQQIPPPLGTQFMPPEIPLFAAAGASERPLCASRGLYGGPFAPVVSPANMNSAGGGTVFSTGVAFPDH